MTLEEIKQAVLDGKTVHWSNTNYHVMHDRATDRWMIWCNNGNVIGLTWSDNMTLNGKEEDFYVAVTAEERLRNVMVEAHDAIAEVSISIGSKQSYEIDLLTVVKRLAAIGVRLIEEANK